MVPVLFLCGFLVMLDWRVIGGGVAAKDRCPTVASEPGAEGAAAP